MRNRKLWWLVLLQSLLGFSCSLLLWWPEGLACAVDGDCPVEGGYVCRGDVCVREQSIATSTGPCGLGCMGCCQGGECLAGLSGRACGSRNVACVVCVEGSECLESAEGRVCSRCVGQCAVPPPTGGLALGAKYCSRKCSNDSDCRPLGFGMRCVSFGGEFGSLCSDSNSLVSASGRCNSIDDCVGSCFP